VITDDRLRLLFTCCHPALAREAQVALTLRLLCGLTTGEIAQAFLVSESAMAARVTRAKKKISAARIPYRVPGAAELPDRLDAVLTVVHLLYTTGHTAPGGADLVRADLVERALGLARLLRALMPDEREVIAMVDGPAAALADIEAIEQEGRLAGYRYLPAAKADLLRRAGRADDAIEAYRTALDLTDNDAERAFLARRIAEVSGSGPG
jgi:predicted RNA polymerase sigma factor